MEFGIFLQGHVPHRKVEQDPGYEHQSFLNDIALAKAADRAGFKYIWVSEHHFLEEYSHISANEVFLGYLAAATERIHLASGIFNVTPQVNHPVRNAERVAMGRLPRRRRPAGFQDGWWPRSACPNRRPAGT